MKKTVTSILTMVLLATIVLPTTALAQENTLDTAATVGLQYKTHVQDYGWEKSWVTDGNLSGTVGQSKRLEALQVALTGTLPAGATIETTVHVQNKGNLGPFAMGTLAGTQGQGLRMENIKLELKNLPGYTLKYNVQVENQGWLRAQLDDSTWYESGQVAGTSGLGLRLESIRIKLIKLNTEYNAYQAALAAVTEPDYTSDSWAAYQTVIKANVVAVTDTDTKIKSATTNITTAQKKLVKGKNMTNYKAALAAAVKAEYTAVTWAEYQKILDANVVSQLNTQAEIDKATANLLEAQKKLQRKVNFTTYRETLAAVREPDFTAETWAAYQVIIANIVITEDSTQTEVDAATQKIIEAQNKMVRKYDFSAYNALLEAVKEKDYTNISWAIYQTILSENVLDSNSTQSEIEAAIKNIEAAQKKLVRASNLIAYNAVLSVAVKTDYTTASWLIYRKVVEENAVTGNHTQAEVDAATAKIMEAQKKLVRAGIMSEYDELLLKVKQEDYTTKSWDVYAKVVSDNRVSPASGQSAIDAVILKIEEAQKKLVLRGDLTKYIAAREACKESAYTSKSWAVYKGVLTANVRTFDDTQAVIDASTAKILEAQKALLKKGDLTAYQALIDAKALEQDKYTDKSWTAYQTSLKSKKMTGDNSQSEIDAAIEAILGFHKALVLKGNLLAYNAVLAAGEAKKATSTNASRSAYDIVVKANYRTTEDAQDVIDKSKTAISDAQLKLVPIAAEYQDYVNLKAENLKKKDDYRTTPWNTYQAVVNANPRTSEDDATKIAASITAIQKAWVELNKEGLVAKEAFAAYELQKSGVKEADYTTESWAEYKKVLAIPANIVTKENSKTEIEAATAAIKAGQAMLVPVGRFDGFMKAIELYSYDLQHINATTKKGEITQRYLDLPGGNENPSYLSWDKYCSIVELNADFDKTGKGVPKSFLKNADEKTINQYTQDILNTKNSVKTIIDTSAYYNVVAKVPLKEKSDQDAAAAKYTKDSLKRYIDRYNDIETTLMAEPIMIKDLSVVTEAAKRLAAAQDPLYLIVKPQIGKDTPFGKAVLGYLFEKEQSKIYTAATWGPYEAAYTEYINTYSVENNTQTQYDLAAEKLEELRAKLVYTAGYVGSAITKEKLGTKLADKDIYTVDFADNLVAEAQNLLANGGYTGYTVELATSAVTKNEGVDTTGKVIAGATNITISFTIKENVNSTNVTTVTITGLTEAKAAAAELALQDYKAKSAEGVNFLDGTKAADATAAKSVAETAITAYKAGGAHTSFDAGKIAADSLYTAGQNIKIAYGAAKDANTAFSAPNAISETTAGNLKTALKALETAVTNNAVAVETAKIANNYVVATKTAAKNQLESSFVVTAANQTTSKGQFSVAAPWLATADLYDPTKFIVSISNSSKIAVVSKLAVAPEISNMLINANSAIDIVATDTVKIKPSTVAGSGSIEEYFNLTKEYTINLAPNSPTPTVANDPFAISGITQP